MGSGAARPSGFQGQRPWSSDEMVDGNGRTRPHWRGIAERAFTLGFDGLRERARLLERAATEEGVASLLGHDRAAWRCDPIPLPLPHDEFAGLARGLAQRADVIELMLRDLYGPQTLLDRGIIPPLLVYGAPGFLRAARGVPERQRRLHLYAADLIRGPDGAWRVLADRCAKPGGLAYALENRRLLWRIAPELFHHDVEPLDPFFEDWRAALRRVCAGPFASEEPGVAVLTEGHRDPAWFEHVVLARELGADLVQGGDLTIRGGRLCLKTLRGLKRIDVLLNRQHVAMLDPLELDWHASAGVPGLLSAWRDGRVALLNDPGAGLAEQPGLAAFLPAVAEVLAGDTLTLPSVETLWLGHETSRDRVALDPEGWLVGAATDAGVPAVAPARLSARAQGRLWTQIERKPWQFTASADLAGSVCPTVEPTRLEARRVVLRLFLVHDGEGWSAFRGGLGRVVADDVPIGASLPNEGVAKDVFVLTGAEPMPRRWSQAPLPLASAVPLAVRRTEGDVPARVAEEFFRLGRQLEMFETSARLIRMLALRLTRFINRPRELVELRILAACLAPLRLLPSDLLIDPAAPGLSHALVRLALSGSPLAEAARDLHGQVDQLRDRLTNEMHFIVTQHLGDVMGAFVGGPHKGFTDNGSLVAPSLDDLTQVTGRMVGAAATLAGFVAETMVRGGGRLFLELGLRLRRAETVTTELRACLGPPASLPLRAGLQGPDLEVGLALALELRDSAITYRQRYLSRVEAAPVLDLVLADHANPRSLGSQLDAVCDLLRRLGEPGDERLADAEQLASANRANVGRILTGDAVALAHALPERLTELEAGIVALRQAVGRRYIDVLPEMQTLRQ